jgi:hypothetical protein
MPPTMQKKNEKEKRFPRPKIPILFKYYKYLGTIYIEKSLHFQKSQQAEIFSCCFHRYSNLPYSKTKRIFFQVTIYSVSVHLPSGTLQAWVWFWVWLISSQSTQFTPKNFLHLKLHLFIYWHKYSIPTRDLSKVHYYASACPSIHPFRVCINLFMDQ